MQPKKQRLILTLITLLSFASSLAFANPGTGGGPGLGHRGTSPGVCKTCK